MTNLYHFRRAIRLDDVAFVRNCLLQGADPEIFLSRSFESPLLVAAESGAKDSLKVLLEFGASIFAYESSTGDTAMHLAAANGHVECIEILDDYCCPLEFENEDGFTPLMCAAQGGHLNAVKFLIAHGVSRGSQLNQAHQSALTVASAQGCLEVVSYLLQLGDAEEDRSRELYSALSNASSKGHLLVAQCLVAHGADVNYPDEGIPSPIHVASRSSHYNTLRWLIRIGADLESRDQDGLTPLMRAVMDRNYCVALILLTAGGSPLTTCNDGVSNAISMASERNDTKMIRLLTKLALPKRN